MFQDRKAWRVKSCFEHPDRWRVLSLILGGVLAAYSVWPQIALSGDKTTMVLATTNSPNERVRVSGGKLPIEKPGWFVELSRRAARECGAKLDFVFMPWPRALQMVERGKVQAAFSSSYKADRAEYGVYPLKDGKPDEDRASKKLIYVAYAKSGSNNGTLAEEDKLQGRTLAAERQASIIPELKKRGASVYEVASDLTMLRMVANGRVDAAVGIEDNVQPILDQYPDLAQLIVKLQPPIQKRVGYVMFSKIFYKDHRELVECFWSTSAQLRHTEWFKSMRDTYE
jgi:polar amino acid transport system substrate-binding protein